MKHKNLLGSLAVSVGVVVAVGAGSLVAYAQTASICQNGFPSSVGGTLSTTDINLCTSFSGCRTLSPMMSASQDAANTLAAALGATVKPIDNILGDSTASQSSPVYELVFPNGYPVDAGYVAYLYNNNFPTSAAQFQQMQGDICGSSGSGGGSSGGTATTGSGNTGTPVVCDNLQIMKGTCVSTGSTAPANPSYCSANQLPPAPANLTFMDSVQQCNGISGACSTENPTYYATLDTANALAKSLGATVVANNNPLGDSNFTYSAPQYELVFPNGFSTTAGSIAQSYQVGGGSQVLQGICNSSQTGGTGGTTGIGGTGGASALGSGNANAASAISLVLSTLSQQLSGLNSTLSSSASNSSGAALSAADTNPVVSQVLQQIEQTVAGVAAQLDVLNKLK